MRKGEEFEGKSMERHSQRPQNVEILRLTSKLLPFYTIYASKLLNKLVYHFYITKMFIY